MNLFKVLILILTINYNSFCQTDSEHPESSIQKLVSGIDEMINDPFFEPTTIALDIFDLTDSISLFKKNEKLLLRPASNMKLFTSATALLNLGENYSFKTDLYHTGIIDGSKLYGDIYVVGGFDPDFSVTDLDSFVTIIKSLGIKDLYGGIYADISKKDSLYWGKGWMWDDDPDPTAPYLSALNINGNSIEVFVEGSEIDSPAVIKLNPNTSYVTVENTLVAVTSNGNEEFFITRDWVNKKNIIFINGEIRKHAVVDSSEQFSKINLLYPEKYFLTLFSEKLEQENITVKNPIDIQNLPNNAVYLASINRSIDSVLTDMNKESDNLDAEMLIYAMAYQDSGAPASAENGLAEVKKLIDTLGFDSDNFSIADGSGVSLYNLVSAELLSELLKYMYYTKKDLFDVFYYSLPVAGIDGTLKKRMKNTSAENNVHAKTGTLNGVSNLSGYATTKNGHMLAFSILIQNFVNEYSTARNIQNKICELLADYN